MAGKLAFSCAALGLAFAAACSKSSEGPSAAALRTCDPLTVQAAPITLGDLVAAGRATDGTVYVLDRGPTGASTGIRAFVSDGSVLRRHVVLGTGEGTGFVIATVDDPAGRIDVRVDLTNGSVTRMAITRNGPDPGSKTFTGGEELALLSSSDVSTFTLVNIAGVRVMYAATTSDGHRFYAFEPTIDLREGTLRVFYGTPDRVAERRVLAESRDSTIHLEIDLDGARTSVQLNFCGTTYPFGPTRLAPEGAPEIVLTPMPGSPGATTCPNPAAADAGLDAGAPSAPADDATLVRGATFLCFGG